jgi:hypothetical protein
MSTIKLFAIILGIYLTRKFVDWWEEKLKPVE